MKWHEWIVNRLMDNGMSREDAIQVFEVIKTSPVHEVMKGRWDTFVIDYAAPVQTAIWIAARRTALKWIEQNRPDAWYKSMFETTIVTTPLT